MSKTIDITYTQDKMFTRFFAESEAGHIAWNHMAEKLGGVAIVLNIHAKSAINQLKIAGYKVGKAKPCKLSLDEILKELGV